MADAHHIVIAESIYSYCISFEKRVKLADIWQALHQRVINLHFKGYHLWFCDSQLI